VRIGHPEMTEFPTMPGFVDLSRISDDIILQANAVARARFAVMTSSGPASLPGALGTPCAMVNATSICLVWRDTDFALPRHFVGPEGEVYNVEQAIAEGSWNDSSIENMIRQAGFQPVDNTPAELQAVAQKLFDQTTDTPGWRARIDPLAHAATYVDRPERHVVGAPIRRSVRIVQTGPKRCP
jgi:putative glycosyltransferase (TIGR04372 family)